MATMQAALQTARLLSSPTTSVSSSVARRTGCGSCAPATTVTPCERGRDHSRARSRLDGPKKQNGRTSCAAVFISGPFLRLSGLVRTGKLAVKKSLSFRPLKNLQISVGEDRSNPSLTGWRTFLAPTIRALHDFALLLYRATLPARRHSGLSTVGRRGGDRPRCSVEPPLAPRTMRGDR